MSLSQRLIFAAGILGGVSLFAQSSAPDETAIREVLSKYVEAREQKDPHAIEALFTTDADQLVSTGEWRKGRGELVKGTLASSQRATGKRTIQVVSVRFLASNVALVDARYEISGAAGTDGRKMWTTLLLTHSSEGWRIAAIRNMLPSPAASR